MSETTLTQFDELPAGLLECDARELHEILPGPSLIHLAGRDPAPLFVSVLLHGNEDTGWEAVRALLRKRAGEELPRAMSIFIGNVAAARYGRRRLEGQADFNRVWQGGPGPEATMAARVLAAMRERRPWLAVDIHNNTGDNPHYGCINRLEPRFFHLAALFARTVVYFIRPEGVLSSAFADLCPAVTLECGMPGQPEGTEHALHYLESLLALETLPASPPDSSAFDLFHTVAVVKVSERFALAVDGHGEAGVGAGGEADAAGELVLPADLDRLNFLEVPAGTPIARFRPASVDARAIPDAGGDAEADTDTELFPVEAVNERGAEVAPLYFSLEADHLLTTRPVMLSMLTLEPEIIRQDCLCYLMERLDPRSFVRGFS